MCQKLRWAKGDAVSIWNCLALEFDSQGGGEESAGEQATMWVVCKWKFGRIWDAEQAWLLALPPP